MSTLRPRCKSIFLSAAGICCGPVEARHRTGNDAWGRHELRRQQRPLRQRSEVLGEPGEKFWSPKCLRCAAWRRRMPGRLDVCLERGARYAYGMKRSGAHRWAAPIQLMWPAERHDAAHRPSSTPGNSGVELLVNNQDILRDATSRASFALRGLGPPACYPSWQICWRLRALPISSAI